MSQELTRIIQSVRPLLQVDPRTRVFAAARATLAAVQLSILLVNSDDSLFGAPAGARQGCTGVAAAALWCVSGSSRTTLGLARLLALAVLLVVISGYRPAWSCVAHWYISASMALCMSAPNGAQFVAQTVTLILIPICLGDDRRWIWTKPDRPSAPRWAGRTAAAYLVLRAQVAVIYLEAALSKLANPAWHDGRALPAVFLSPQFGLPSFVKPLAAAILSAGPLMRAAGLSVIAVELLIAALFLGPARFRAGGVLLVFALHLGIVLLMGLLPFGLTMCAVAVLAVSDRKSRSASDTPVRTGRFTNGAPQWTWRSRASSRTGPAARTSRTTSPCSPSPRRSTVRTLCCPTSRR